MNLRTVRKPDNVRNSGWCRGLTRKEDDRLRRKSKLETLDIGLVL